MDARSLSLSSIRPRVPAFRFRVRLSRKRSLYATASREGSSGIAMGEMARLPLVGPFNQVAASGGLCLGAGIRLDDANIVMRHLARRER
jgi:hypothetical protein